MESGGVWWVELSGSMSSCSPECPWIWHVDSFTFFFFAVLGFELTAYTLSHSISPFVVIDLF
jgi:hypothetical protein